MNYRKYVAGKLTQAGIELDIAAQLASAIWEAIYPVFNAMMEQTEAGHAFDWEQLRDSAIRQSRVGPKIDMVPLRLVGVEYLHQMLGIAQYMRIEIVPKVPPEESLFKTMPLIVVGQGSQQVIGEHPIEKMDPYRIPWDGPRKNDGTPMLYYESVLHVDAPEEMPPFETDYEDVIAFIDNIPRLERVHNRIITPGSP